MKRIATQIAAAAVLAFAGVINIAQANPPAQGPGAPARPRPDQVKAFMAFAKVNAEAGIHYGAEWTIQTQDADIPSFTINVTGTSNSTVPSSSIENTWTVSGTTKTIQYEAILDLPTAGTYNVEILSASGGLTLKSFSVNELKSPTHHKM